MRRATGALWSVMIGGLLTAASIAVAQVPVQVDCNIPEQTLARALGVTQPGDILRVIGTCNESVTITTDRLTLDGLGSAIVDAGSAGAAVITIEGAQGVTIRGLTVRNSVGGILVQRAAAVTLEAVTAEDNSGAGFQIDENATVRMRDCTAQRNDGNGMEVRRSANVTMLGSVVSRDNGFHGISIFDAASVVLSGVGAEITGNAQSGILVGVASGLSIGSIRESDGTIRGSEVTVNTNASDGIQIGSTSHLTLNGGSSISASQNNRFGLFVLDTSSVLSFDAITATENGSDGIHIARASSLEVGGQGALTSQNNGRNGLTVLQLAIGIAFDNTTVTLSNNRDQDCFVESNSVWQALGTVNIITTATCNSNQNLDFSSTFYSTGAKDVPQRP